jgi:hypothetical protein
MVLDVKGGRVNGKKKKNMNNDFEVWFEYFMCRIIFEKNQHKLFPP